MSRVLREELHIRSAAPSIGCAWGCSMSSIELQRLSERAERHIVALRAIVDLLWEVLGPVGLAGVGGALMVILVEWVRWLAG
jgi:hypothetical protein